MAKSGLFSRNNRKAAADLAAIAKHAEQAADDEAETLIRKIASDAAQLAPVDTGKLSNSLPAGVERESIGVWTIRDGTDYTLVQEYTHKTHKAFIRRAVWNNEANAGEGIRARIVKGV